MSDYRNDDENKELTGQTMSDDHKTEDKHEDEYEKYCYLCRRPESVAGKMIDMPGNIHICADCMQKTMDTMNNNGFGECSSWIFRICRILGILIFPDLWDKRIFRKSRRLRKTEKPKKKRGRIVTCDHTCTA